MLSACAFVVGLFASVLPSGALHVRSPEQGQNPSACPTQRTHFPGTFDVVITWYTETGQSHLRDPSKVQLYKHPEKHEHIENKTRYNYSENHGRIENQNEITYLLRGIDQFGMLSKVGNIFIVLDKLVVQNHGAPRHVNWKHPKIKAIYTQDLGIQGASSISAKMASFHMIPGISEWFLYLQDDIMIARQFSNSLLFAGNGKPIMWLNKDLFRTQPGNCPTNGYSIDEGPDHLPWLVNKCYMEMVAQQYATHFAAVRMDMSSWFSARCTYDSWMSANSLYEEQHDLYDRYGQVCHLGIQWSQCPIGTNAAGVDAAPAVKDVFKNPATFLNLQGSGMSDDYPPDHAVTDIVLNWLHTTYSSSSLTV